MIRNKMDSFRPITSRDLEILAIPEGYDSIQVTLSRFTAANETVERETLKTGYMSLAEFTLLQTCPTVREPHLTELLQEMDRRGLDPMKFIKFIGERAIQL